MHQINISDETYQKVQRLAKDRQMEPSEVLELLVVEEAATEAQLRDQMAALLAERRQSAGRGNTKPASAVLDRLAAKYVHETP